MVEREKEKEKKKTNKQILMMMMPKAKVKVVNIVTTILLVIVALLKYRVTCNCPHSQDGLTRTSTLPNWNTEDSEIVIQSNQKVLVDSSPQHRLKSITVNGELIFDDSTDLNIDVEWIRVNPNAKFMMGSQTCPITKKIIITFIGGRSLTGNNRLGTDPQGQDVLGDNGIAFVSGSHAQIFGNVQGVKSWTRLRQTATKGTNTLYIEDNQVNWKKGDRVVIASTDFGGPLVGWPYTGLDNSLSYMRASRSFEDQNEYAFLSQDSSNGVLVLDRPLNWTHWGQGYERAEVGLLTRNIVFRGNPNTAENEKFGGHIMIRNVLTGQFSGIELYYMGQQSVVGRYPFHFHLLGDKIGSNIFFKDSSIHDIFQRCVTIHDSHGILIQNVVSYNCDGHCYFLEDGGERRNVFDNNLGVKVNPISLESNRQIIPTDNEPSVFWITNPDNDFTNNVAVGGKFGFWYILPVHPTGLSEDRYDRNHPEVRPRWTPLGKFENNVAHSTINTGLEVDNMLRSDGKTQLASYHPRKPPFTPTNVALWQLQEVTAHFKNFIAYKNRRYGIWTRGGPIRVSGAILLDNLHGINLVPGASIFEDSIVIGETDNVGHANHPDEKGRSRPDRWSVNAVIKGYETYDNGGPQYVRNVSFFDFQTNDVRPAGALGALSHAPFMHQTRNRYIDLKFTNCNKFYILDTHEDSHFGANILDLDGSITGMKGNAWIVADTTLNLAAGNCTRKQEWNAHICSPFPEGYVQITVKNNDFSGTPMPGYEELRDTSKRLVRATFHQFNEGNTQRSYDAIGASVGQNVFQVMVNAIPRRGYTLRTAHNTPTPFDMSISMSSSAFGDWLVFALPYPPSAQPFTLTHTEWGNNAATMQKVDSLEKLSKSTYYYDTSSEHLFIMLTNNNPSFTERWGFNDYEIDGSEVRIKASCTTCAPGRLDIPNASILNPITSNYDQYRADLNSCQQPGSNSNAEGTGFFFFDKKTSQLHTNIYHSLSSDVTGLIFQVGSFLDSDATPRRIPISRISAISPIRSVISLSVPEWQHLVKGQLHVTVTTKQYPNGEIRGHILCTTRFGCKVPPQVPLITPSAVCPTISSNSDAYTIFTESIPGWPGWDIWQWGDDTVRVLTQEEALCGNYSVKVGISSGGIIFGHHTSTQRPNPVVDTSIFKYFQFFIKVNSGNGTIQLQLAFEDTTTRFSHFVLSPNHISDFKIDDTKWTRVRIPVSELKFPNTNQNVQKILFHFPYSAQPSFKMFYIDNVQFVKGDDDATVQKTSLVPHNEIAMYSETYCQDMKDGRGPAAPEEKPDDDGSDDAEPNVKSLSSSNHSLPILAIAFNLLILSTSLFLNMF